MTVFVVGGFLFAGKAEAATVYVSNSDTNGYSSGNDSNSYVQAQNKATPWLTLTKAVSFCANGDTIVINDGTYNEAAAVIGSKYGLTITNDSITGVIGGVIIKAVSGGTRVIHLNQNGSTSAAYTIGPIVIDANNSQSSGITIDSTNDVNNLVINGTIFKNPTAAYITTTGHLKNLTMSGNWSAQSNTALPFGGFGLSGSAVSPGIYAISNGTITQTNIGGVNNHAFTIQPTVAGLTVNITDVTINMTAAATGGTIMGIFASNTTLNTNRVNMNITGANNFLYGVYAFGQATSVISSGVFTFSGSGATMYGIYGVGQAILDISSGIFVFNGASANMYGIWASNLFSAKVNRNNFTFSGSPSLVGAINITNGASITNFVSVYDNTGNLGATTGYTIFIGDDGVPAISNQINNVDIYNNNITGSNHGYAVGYITGAKIHNNTSDGLVIGILTKYSTNTLVYNNIVKNYTTGGGLRDKGSTGGQFFNNTVITGDSSVVGFLITDSASGGYYKNNLLYSERNTLDNVKVDPGSSSTFLNNNYYTLGTYNVGSWEYQGVSYNSLAAFKNSGHDVDSLNSTPFIISDSLPTLTRLSPNIDAGTAVPSLTTDYLGNPIYGTPDIGAYEYQPPYRISTDKIEATGNIRIYGDGKYRYTTATSSATQANLSVVPAEGSWTYAASTTRPEWLNISDIAWGTTKQWTASSSSATTTIYMVGDLTPNAYYTVKYNHDNAGTTTLSSLQADADGKITFTYDAGYSTVIFDVSPVTPTATPTVTPTPRSTTSSSSGGTAQSRVSNLIAMGLYGEAQKVAKQYNIAMPTIASDISGRVNQAGATASSSNAASVAGAAFTRTLRYGMTGNDVKQLQIFLNAKGFTVSKAGAGSRGHETNYFGGATKSAVIRFQEAYRDAILKPQGLTVGTGLFGEGTRGFVRENY